MPYDKVVDSQALDGALGAVADAIRGKTGSVATLTLEQMPGAISGIQTGGAALPELSNPGTSGDLMKGKELIGPDGRAISGSFTLDSEISQQDALIEQIRGAVQGLPAGGGGATVIEALEITENGVYNAPEGVDGYSPIVVNVEGSGGGENQLHGALDGTLDYIDSPVTKVIQYACYGITTLKTVNLPNCTSIGSYAFRGCSGITSFNAPKVTSLNSYAFYGCSGLIGVNFPAATSVGGTCFYQCTKLVRADFGAKCKTLNGSALAYCSKLETLILRYTEGVVSIATNTFSGANFDGYVYVPAALLADYEANESWASYTTGAKFRTIEDYPDVCG